MNERFGPYEILRRIGAGGMAEVHLARRFGASGWEKLVAIKRLRPEQRGQPERERLLITEARLGARFAHSGLVGVRDFGLVDGAYYVCMDYVDGADLAALIARRPLPRPLALLIAEQLATTLAYVHALTDAAGRPLGLVHRDVSPANVLCSRAGEVKLSDFGIAKATAEHDRTWGRVRKGKYAYMAPEQISGEPITAAADLFSLGVTVHECLLGRRPFDGDNPMQLMEAIRDARLAADHDFGDLDPKLVALLRSALARDPRLRPSGGAAELARGLRRARLRHDPVGSLDLAAWICTTLDGVGGRAQAAADAALETLGMDDEG
ncbi:MAG: serine/threonine-protein kinase [Enhygromyxa sp.]